MCDGWPKYEGDGATYPSSSSRLSGFTTCLLLEHSPIVRGQISPTIIFHSFDCIGMANDLLPEYITWPALIQTVEK